MGGKTKLSAAEYHRQYRARKAAARAAAAATPAAKQSTPQPIPAPTQSKAPAATPPPSQPPAATVIQDDDAALWLDDPPSAASADSNAQPHPTGEGGNSSNPSNPAPLAPVATLQLCNDSNGTVIANIAGEQVEQVEQGNNRSGRSGEAGVKGKQEEQQQEGKAGERGGGEGGESRREAPAKLASAKQGTKATGEGFFSDALLPARETLLRHSETLETLPKSGQVAQNVQRSPSVDFKPARYAAPPCSLEVFDRVCFRLMRGDFWRDIAKDEDILWENVRARAGSTPEFCARWADVEAARRAAFAADIEETGQVLLATARAELPAVEEDGTTAHGPTSRRSYQRAASTAQAGAALLQPATHGKLAAQRDTPGSGSGSIIVNIAVAPGILPPGAPPVILLQQAPPSAEG